MNVPTEEDDNILQSHKCCGLLKYILLPHSKANFILCSICFVSAGNEASIPPILKISLAYVSWIRKHVCVCNVWHLVEDG